MSKANLRPLREIQSKLSKRGRGSGWIWRQGGTPTPLQRLISIRSLSGLAEHHHRTALMWHGWVSAQCQRHRSNGALGWLERLARYGRAPQHYGLSGIQMGLHHLPRGISGLTAQVSWRRDQDGVKNTCTACSESLVVWHPKEWNSETLSQHWANVWNNLCSVSFNHTSTNII